MIVERVESSQGQWRLIGPLGEELIVPSSDATAFDLATIGTGFDATIKQNRTARFADALAALQRPIHLIDIRRNGSGGSGSWGARELASVVPGRFERRDIPYSYIHLPALAPTLELLGAFQSARRLLQPSQSELSKGVAPAPALAPVETPSAVEDAQHLRDERVPAVGWHRWQVFRARFLRELPEVGVLAGRALVEGACARGALAVFLCAEGRASDFDAMDQEAADAAYCHRFTAVASIARCLREESGTTAGHRANVRVRRIDLEPGHEPTTTTL